MEVTNVTLEPQLRNCVTVFFLRVTPTKPSDDKRSRAKLTIEDATIWYEFTVTKAGRGDFVLGEVVTVQALNCGEVHLTFVAAGPNF